MKRVAYGIACGAVAALLAGCGAAEEGTAHATAALPPHALTPAQLSFLKFARVGDVEPASLADLSGTIEFDEQHTARLNAPAGGRVAELLVQVGDRVAADQPLLAVDSSDVKTAQAEYVRADADLRLAKNAAERAERLRAARAIAEKDYQQAQEEARKAGADFDKARAGLERLHLAPGERSSRYLLRAPFAGTVVERKASVGMAVGPESGDPLVVVSDLSEVRVVLRVPERQLPLVRAGQEIGVRVDAYPDQFPGRVVAVGDVIDDATRTVPVRCTVSNPDRLLKPAMFARVTLRATPGTHVLAVPVTALLSDGQRFRVIVRRPDGSLAEQGVEVGPEVDGRVQVLSGIVAGDEIVTDGALFAAQELAG